MGNGKRKPGPLTALGRLTVLALFFLGLAAAALLQPAEVSADNGPHGNYSATTDTCAGCHRSHTAGAASLLLTTTPGLCLTCHGTSATGADTNVDDGLYVSRDPVNEVPPEGVDGRGLKGGGFVNAQIDTDGDGTFTAAPVTSGHDGNNPYAWGNGAIGSGPGGALSLSCDSCHDPHGSGGYHSLRAVPTGSGAAPVVVADEATKTYSIASATGDYTAEYYPNAAPLSQWCSTCHTRYYATSGSGHTSSGDPIFDYRHATDSVPCVECHVAHGTSATMGAFAGTPVLYPDASSATTDSERSSLLRLDDRRICYNCHVDAGTGQVNNFICTSCHNQPQGPRRQITGTGGDFDLATHHVSSGAVDTDCKFCHDISAHRSGNIVLFDADTRVTSLYTGFASLESYCLACHDADGAGGNAPFSDGVMPPVIDAAVWSAASHETGASAPQTCFGACHQNGHGSGLAGMLNPWNGSPGPGNASQEEGFCYGCHGAAGPAAVDVEAQFALTSQHNITPGDPGGEFMECTNCHNPHLANGTQRLADPDDTSSIWTGTFENFCLACHDGTAPVAFPATPSAFGFDKSAFPGSTHDTQTGGTDSCRQCHTQHGSSYNTILLDQYITADYNTWSFGDGDYAMCWACHDEATIIRDDQGNKGWNRFEDLHDKHVRGEDAPCIMCHDTHSPYDAGEPGLINLEMAIKNGASYTNGRNASTAFEINGNQGSCYISCHGKDHTPKTYNRGP